MAIVIRCMLPLTLPFVHIHTVAISAGELIHAAGREAQRGPVGLIPATHLGVIVYGPLVWSQSRISI